MTDKRLILARVFTYGLLCFQVLFLAASLPQFIEAENWGGTLLMLGFTAGSVIVLVIYPGLPKVMARVRYGLVVVTVLTFSAFVAGVAMARLPLLSMPQAARASDYVAVLGSVVFAVANILAIAATARSRLRS